MDPGYWSQLPDCLTDQLQFKRQPASSAIPIGSTLVSVRHHDVASKSDLQNDSEHSNFSPANLDANPGSWNRQTNLDEEFTTYSGIIPTLAGTFITFGSVTPQTSLVRIGRSWCICKRRCVWHWRLYPNCLTSMFLVLWTVCQTRFHCSSDSDWR